MALVALVRHYAALGRLGGHLRRGGAPFDAELPTGNAMVTLCDESIAVTVICKNAGEVSMMKKKIRVQIVQIKFTAHGHLCTNKGQQASNQ